MSARTPVIVDAVIGVAGMIPLGVGISGVDDTESDERKLGAAERTAAITVGAAVIVAATYSIVTGLRRSRECRAAMLDYVTQPAP